MSAEASEAVSRDGSEEKVEAAPAEAPGPQVESEHDRFETLITYSPNAKLPVAVALIWVCALIGLGAYSARFYFPDLALWGGH